MDVGLILTYRLVLTRDEFRILSKALRCTLKDDEKVLALELQKKMLIEKHKYLEQAAHESSKAVNNIEDAEQGE